MTVDNKLFQACVDFINNRFPSTDSEEGAAAMYTDEGDILVSTAPDIFNAGAGLCHETGAICDAYKNNKKIAASICVSREKDGSYIVLTPCGICQERLYLWGGEVEVGTPDPGDISKWVSKKLKEVQPYYWAKPFIESE